MTLKLKEKYRILLFILFVYTLNICIFKKYIEHIHLLLTLKKLHGKGNYFKVRKTSEKKCNSLPGLRKGQASLSLEAPLKYKCPVTLCLLIALLSRQCQFCESTCRLSRQDVKGPCRSCYLVLAKGPKALVYYRRHPKDRCFRLRGVMENNSTLDS